MSDEATHAGAGVLGACGTPRSECAFEPAVSSLKTRGEFWKAEEPTQESTPRREDTVSDASRNPTSPAYHRVTSRRALNFACRLPQPLPGEAAQAVAPHRQTMTDIEFGYVLTLAQDYLRCVLQVPQPGSGLSRTSRVLQNVASLVQKEVEKNLKPCLDNIDVTSIDSARAVFNEVMEKEFEDGVINWGRIVTVFAFEGILVKKLLQKRVAPDVDTYKEIAHVVADFVTKNTGEWIRQNGGWENGFVKKFGPRSGWLTFLEVTGKICEMLSLLQQYY